MTMRDVLIYPDIRLRSVAEPVCEINDEVRALVDQMFDLMYARQGIGLAATQVDMPLSLIVIDLQDKSNPPLVLINPEIVEKSDAMVNSEEGCLSFPNVYVKVARVEKIKFKAQNLEGEWFERETDGLLSVCVQHEIDHLEGKLIADYLSSLKKHMLHKKMKKLKKTVL
ncbi:MAG: peptide deformylase [Gammaproteobacteria bacterium RIFCSPHIGHO2_02_FULL_42_13]|nr:MAG: peptide deformylase [Gammaproteobacteria bacterium RIFCSPHIGHO2_02_FULL_42_13]OGT68652.1 MAG: peptide deformylase [Gammaproteobacteria bacterium RIFCSPLOWO2_02_FULL_42_9]